MSRPLAGALVALGLVVGLGPCSERAPEPAPPACQEDEPCWDCETMGNLVCGPGARD